MTILTVTALVFGTLQRLPKSEAFYVIGTVISKSTQQGYGPSGDTLIVELENGVDVIASNPIQTGVRVGDKVKLSGYERYVFPPIYEYLSKIKN